MNAVHTPMGLKLESALTWLSQARGVNLQSAQADRVHTDSRSLRAGDVFVALRGERFDGNQFIAQAKAPWRWCAKPLVKPRRQPRVCLPWWCLTLAWPWENWRRVGAHSLICR
jgi:UDP-N-acetylmuramyl pentapeptide synthase